MNFQKLLLIEFKKIHLCETRWQRYRTHINKCEYQTHDCNRQNRYLIRHIFECAESKYFSVIPGVLKGLSWLLSSIQMD